MKTILLLFFTILIVVQNLNIYVLQNEENCQYPDCDGSYLKPFHNLVQAFQYGQESEEQEFYFLLSDKFLILEEYFIENNYQFNEETQKYTIFGQKNKEIQISPDNCFSDQQCDKNIEIIIKTEKFSISILNYLKLLNLKFNGLDMNAQINEELSCYKSTSNYCCSVNQLENKTEENLCCLQNKQLNRTIPSGQAQYGLFNLITADSSILIQNCTFEYLNSIQKFSSGGAFYSLIYDTVIIGNSNTKNITLKDITIDKCYFYNGILNSEHPGTQFNFENFIILNFNYYNIVENQLEDLETQFKFGQLANITIKNSQFSKNRLYFENSSIISIENSLFTDFATKENGGLLFFGQNSTISFNNVEISFGQAQLAGGCAYFGSQSTINIENLEISYCSSLEQGGAIYFGEENNIIFSSIGELMVAYNLATLSGGAFYIDYNSTVLLNSQLITFLNNTAGGDGGGIYAETLNSFTVQTNSLNFLQNSASNAGCIYFTPTINAIILKFDLCNFYNNIATYDAGCFHLTNDNQFTLQGTEKTQCNFVGNQAGLNGGVLEAISNVTLILNQISFIDSLAGSQGGSLYIENYINIDLIAIVIQNSVSVGDGAFLEFKFYGAINMQDILLSDCQNPSGNGIVNIGYNIVVNIYNSNFSNTITQRGTAAFVNNNEIYMENCTFFNVTAQYGGHMRIRKNNIGNFKNINFTMSEALFGGIAEIDFDNIINMENIIVKSGAGYTSGSFLYLEQNITFTLKGTDYCDISDLSGSAAFYIGTDNVRVYVSNCYFHNVSSPTGTIVYSANLGTIFLQNVTIENSYASAGGVFNLVTDSNLTLINIISKNCTCLKQGGFIVLYLRNNAWLTQLQGTNFIAIDGGFVQIDNIDNYIEISNSTFSNIKVSTSGAFGYINSNNIFKLLQTKISNSVASVKGGLLDVEENNQVLIQDCVITEIKADEQAGLIFVNNNNSIEILNCDISFVESEYGGGFYVLNYNNISIMSTLIQNIYGEFKGGLLYFIEENSISFSDCILKNITSIEGAAIYLDYDQIVYIVILY